MERIQWLQTMILSSCAVSFPLIETDDVGTGPGSTTSQTILGQTASCFSFFSLARYKLAQELSYIAHILQCKEWSGVGSVKLKQQPGQVLDM